MKKSVWKMIGGALISVVGMVAAGAIGGKMIGEGMAENILETEAENGVIADTVLGNEDSDDSETETKEEN